MYSETRGFYYEADLKGISDAEENVRKAKMNKQIAEYEKQIKSLQDSMESETKSIDDQIKKLNEYSEAWGKVSTQLEEAQNRLRATEILGPDWENNIKNGLSLLQDFTNQYITAQQNQKNAYLEARRAEAENPVGGSGGENGNKTNSTGTQPPTVSTDIDNKDPKDEYETVQKTAYWYNGTAYGTDTEANAAKRADMDTAYQNAYNKEYEKWRNKPIPESVKQTYATNAGAKARDAISGKNVKKETRTITQKKAYYQGTESAQRGEGLVGEFKPEIVLHKNGTASIVDEPTLMDLQGGEKIFNGDETEKILKSKYKPLSSVNPKKFAMLHAFAGGTTSPMQRMIAAQAVGIASGIKSGVVSTSSIGGQTINQTFNVTLPNITDASKATDLMREFQQMSMKATQYFKRRD